MPTAASVYPPDDVENIRRQVMGGLASIGAFALAVNSSRRSVERWVARGELPVVHIGRTPFVNVTAVMASRSKQPPA